MHLSVITGEEFEQECASRKSLNVTTDVSSLLRSRSHALHMIMEDQNLKVHCWGPMVHRFEISK